MAPRHALDLDRLIFVGHSAGGHLALWAAARQRLKPSSPLHAARPLVPRGVVNLAGRMDMTKGIAAYEAVCKEPVVTSLLSGTPSGVPERYADASPSSMLPLGVRQVMIWGEFEDNVPAEQAVAYVAAARKAGDDVRLVTMPGAGHFETASPFSTAWPVVYATIAALRYCWWRMGGSRSTSRSRTYCPNLARCGSRPIPGRGSPLVRSSAR